MKGLFKRREEQEAGVEVQGADEGLEGLRQRGAVTQNLPARELEALPGDLQAPAPAIELIIVYHRAGTGDTGAAPAARRDEHMPAAAMDGEPGAAFLAIARLEVISAGDLAPIEIGEHAVHVNSYSQASS